MVTPRVHSLHSLYKSICHGVTVAILALVLCIASICTREGLKCFNTHCTLFVIAGPSPKKRRSFLPYVADEDSLGWCTVRSCAIGQSDLSCSATSTNLTCLCGEAGPILKPCCVLQEEQRSLTHLHASSSATWDGQKSRCLVWQLTSFAPHQTSGGIPEVTTCNGRNVCPPCGRQSVCKRSKNDCAAMYYFPHLVI